MRASTLFLSVTSSNQIYILVLSTTTFFINVAGDSTFYILAQIEFLNPLSFF